VRYYSWKYARAWDKMDMEFPPNTNGLAKTDYQTPHPDFSLGFQQEEQNREQSQTRPKIRPAAIFVNFSGNFQITLL